MRPQNIVSEIRNLMGYHDIIALDNGVYKIWFARNYLAFQPNTILLDNALATMGAGPPSAMLAAMIHPNRKVMSICGDGGFMMNSQEIETAVRLNLNLVVLVLNDNSYGMIRWKQAGSGFEDWGLEYNNPDFVKYAESYGAHGHRITSVNGFGETVDRAYREGGVHLIDMPVDYSKNVKELIRMYIRKYDYILSRYGFRPNSLEYFITQTHVTTGTKQTNETLTKANDNGFSSN